MPRTNKDKEPDPIIDEVLAETPPPIDEPSDPEEVTDIPEDEILPDPENEDPEPEVAPETTPKAPPPTNEESSEDKEKRYKAQQMEAQIQVERTKHLTQKVEEADGVVIPTEQDLRVFVKEDGQDWDELTTFEQTMAKKAYISEKRFNIVHEAIQSTKQIDEWAKSIDNFIDSTDSKPEYIELSGHEVDFRKFAMKENHRGTPMELLLGAFLHDLPPVKKSNNSLFERGSGGEKPEVKTGINDAEEAANLRKNDPREYARQIKAGKIKIEI